MMIYFVIITLLQQLIPSQTPEQFSKLPCSTAVPLKLYNYNINILHNKTQRVCETISIIKMLTINKKLLWPRDLESFKGGNFNTLSLVDCYVQICNGTAVEHGSLLNCSGVCDGINCCKSVIITK
jgi:hypothetical protein